MREFYAALHCTAEACGLSILTDSQCCELLAWVNAYGGATEAVTFNVRLNEDIRAAQRRLNLYGGQTPNPALIDELRARLREVDPHVGEDGQLVPGYYFALTGQFVHPPWVAEICQRYGLPMPPG